MVRRAVDYQVQQSSRPCYQFLHQFCQEREWIKMGLSNQDQDQQTNLDTRAYETVKLRWIRDGIWDDDWTFIPGTSWRHERPRKTLDPQKRHHEQDARQAARIERAERPPRWYSMAPVALLTRINWPTRQPVPLEATSDPSSPSVLEPSSEVKPSLRSRSTKSRIHWHTEFFGSTRKSTAEAKPDPNGQEDDEPRTESAAKEATVNLTSTNPRKKSSPEAKGQYFTVPCRYIKASKEANFCGEKEERVSDSGGETERTSQRRYSFETASRSGLEGGEESDESDTTMIRHC